MQSPEKKLNELKEELIPRRSLTSPTSGLKRRSSGVMLMLSTQQDVFAEEPLQPIEEVPPNRDNRCKAIIAINLFSVSIVFTSVIWKHLAEEGVNVIDFNFFRNFTIWCLASIALCIG